MINTKVTQSKPHLSQAFNDMMAESCPIWAWCNRKDMERKNMKF